MNAYLESPIGRLVAEKPARSRVFERWGLDYCCGGKRTLAEACAKKGLDADAVARELNSCDTLSPAPRVDWTQQSITALCDHIESTHHAYLREALPRLSYLTDRVAQRHGERDPRLAELNRVFEAFRAELEAHTKSEDEVLFPMLRAIDAGEAPSDQTRSVIQRLIAEHDEAGAGLETMASLTNGFTPVEGDCNTHRAMLQALGELAFDMHLHVNLENHVLFPRAQSVS